MTTTTTIRTVPSYNDTAHLTHWIPNDNFKNSKWIIYGHEATLIFSDIFGKKSIFIVPEHNLIHVASFGEKNDEPVLFMHKTCQINTSYIDLKTDFDGLKFYISADCMFFIMYVDNKIVYYYLADWQHIASTMYTCTFSSTSTSISTSTLTVTSRCIITNVGAQVDEDGRYRVYCEAGCEKSTHVFGPR